MPKPSLLLLPGLLCDEALWRGQIDALGAHASITVADMTRPGVLTMADMARSVLEQAPGERFALAGLSMGGYCALEIVRQAPQRVERLALLDTSARPDTPEQRQRRQDLMALCQRGDFNGVSRTLLGLFIHASRLDDQALVDDIVAMTRRVGPEAFLRQQRAILSRPDSRPDLPRIACAALVLCGRQDALTPLAVHEEMAAMIPRARLHIVEDSGHLPTMERPEAVSTALKAWLWLSDPAAA